jgi:hypothetical protein
MVDVWSMVASGWMGSVMDMAASASPALGSALRWPSPEAIGAALGAVGAVNLFAWFRLRRQRREQRPR